MLTWSILTALRRTDFDAHLAHDVAQLVFTDLARKAPSLSRTVVLGGWLHRATLYAAAQMMRSDRRRRLREQAAAMTALESETATDWQAIRPALDEALDKLNQTDRNALLLRYFEHRSLAEIGSALGTNEDAAGKRVKRALEKLRVVLVRRGITHYSSSALYRDLGKRHSTGSGRNGRDANQHLSLKCGKRDGNHRNLFKNYGPDQNSTHYRRHRHRRAHGFARRRTPCARYIAQGKRIVATADCATQF